MKITVREIIFVHAYAVINHSVRAGKLIELRAVHAYDRQSHRFFLREFVMGHSVERFYSVIILSHELRQADVVIQIGFVRLVGKVHIRLFGNTEFFEMRSERGEILLQKREIFLVRRGDFPAENLLLFSVFGCDDLRASLAAPLREQMRKFEVFYPSLFAYSDDFVEFRKIKVILLATLRYLHELRSEPFSPDFGIERGRERGYENHIVAHFRVSG